MTPKEERFIHFVQCMAWLNNSWCLLKEILSADLHAKFRIPAIRFALIEYSKPYKDSRGYQVRRHRLDIDYIPVEFHELHYRVINSRDQIHAHTDLTVLDAKIFITQLEGRPSFCTTLNYINDGEMLMNIDQIILMIEGTLSNMYIKEKELEKSVLT